MSATDFPYWSSTPTLDLMTAADENESTAARIAEHVPAPAADDRELATFLNERAADMRAEISRRLGTVR